MSHEENPIRIYGFQRASATLQNNKIYKISLEESNFMRSIMETREDEMQGKYSQLFSLDDISNLKGADVS